MNKKGFSLVEIIIVVAIMMIIVGIAVPQFSYIQRNARVKTDIRAAEQIGRAVRMWLTATDVGTSELRWNELKQKKVYSELPGIDDYIETTFEPTVFVGAKFYVSVNDEKKVEVRIAEESTKETTNEYTITNCYQAGIVYTEK